MPKIHVFDSLTKQEFPNHKVFAVTYEPKWQIMRMSFSFQEGAKTRNALALMEAYVASSPNDHELRCRAFRVANLLRALPLGQQNSTGLYNIPAEVEVLVGPYRKQASQRALAVGQPTEWDWNVSRQQLVIVRKEDPVAFRSAGIKLHRRWMQHRKDPKPEMMYFMNLIKEVDIAAK